MSNSYVQDQMTRDSQLFSLQCSLDGVSVEEIAEVIYNKLGYDAVEELKDKLDDHLIASPEWEAEKVEIKKRSEIAKEIKLFNLEQKYGKRPHPKCENCDGTGEMAVGIGHADYEMVPCNKCYPELGGQW